MFAICAKTGIMFKMRSIFSCIGTEHLRHQFIHLFDNISEGDIKAAVQLSIFLIDLFVGTCRLSIHARLEAFVIQTKLNFLQFYAFKTQF